MSQTCLDKINAVLPQTQCGECGYDGCRPYANAMIENNETIDLCLPGGQTVLQQLSQLLNQDATPLMDEMANKQLPPSVAVIQEDLCIGCTKCIQACPVDAVLGSAKQMHTVIEKECTGCRLCVEPCPMDCIDIIELDQPQYSPKIAQQRYEFRNARLQRDQQQRYEKHQQKKLTNHFNDKEQELAAKKAAIQAAVARAKVKKIAGQTQ